MSPERPKVAATSRMRRAGAFLSIFFGPGLLLYACLGSLDRRPHYDIYDEAVSLYFRAPRDTAAAIKLLRRACDRGGEGRDLSCYNLGAILELESRQAEALEAYREAARLSPNPVYKAAVQRMAIDPDSLPSAYQQFLARAIAACHSSDTAAALEALNALTSQAAAAHSSDAPVYRDVLEQPFFRDCLGQKPAYTALLARLRKNPENAGAAALAHRARNHEFASLWDMEFFLRNGAASPRNSTTTAWEQALSAAGQGDAGAYVARLKDFVAALEARQANASAGEKARILAMRRAAGILTLHDPNFARVRDNPTVRALAESLVTGP